MLETAPKIPYTLIQPRTKNTPNIAKDALVLFDAQPFAQETHYSRKILIGAEFEDTLSEMGGGAYGLKTDCDCIRGVSEMCWFRMECDCL